MQLRFAPIIHRAAEALWIILEELPMRAQPSAITQVTRRGFMAASTTLLAQAAQRNRPQRPNVILILCDDLGYADIGCNGSSIPTPNIDRLAQEGSRFTSCNTANPVCSPSRAGLLTGRYPTRVQVPRVFFPRDTTGLALDEVTLPQVLKTQGYKTKCVGKWHLGHTAEYLPTARGFDEYFGIPYSNDMKPAVLMRDTKVIAQEADQTQLVPQYTKESQAFIEANRNHPFFLYLPHNYPHIPLHASERFRGKSKQGLYGDVVQEIDWSVGEILNTLKRTGADRNTIVIFSSDNGPWYLGSPGKHRNRKGSTYEGGVRVPLLVRWPGHVPAGRVSSSLISQMDLLPTIAGLAGADLPVKPLDGVNMWPLLSGKAETVKREALLYFDGWNLQAARLDQWKLHVARYNAQPYQAAPAGGRHNLKLSTPELYNLELDPDESYDIADRHAEIVRDISARIEKLLPTFPQEVQQAWQETQARASRHYTSGSLPQMLKR